MHTMMRQLDGFEGSQYEERVREKPELYTELQRRVNHFTSF